MKITKKQFKTLTDVLVDMFSAIDDVFTKHPECRPALDDTKIDKAVKTIGILMEKVKESK